MNSAELQSFLDEKVTQYNTRDFIDSDPVQIPHLFSQKEDIEIAGFLAATIAWGNRKMIIKNAHRMMELMGNSPYDFVLSHQENDLKDLESFVHRTFNGQDFIGFIKGLQHIYQNHNGLEAVFSKENPTMQHTISDFKQLFFDVENFVIQEYRFYRYLFLTTVKCLFILIFVPLGINFLAKNYFIHPVTEYYWNTHNHEIFLNSYQQKRAFTQLKNFEENKRNK